MENEEPRLTQEQFNHLLKQVEEGKKRSFTIREAAALLENGKISVEQYTMAMEQAIGKEKFWKIHNECLQDYFKGFNFNMGDRIKNELIKEQENEATNKD